MEKLLDTIRFKYSDPVISNRLGSLSEDQDNYPIFFSQNEDEFIRSPGLFHIPSMRIHHNLSLIKPSDEYLEVMRGIIDSLSSIFPNLFIGTRYYFDPAEVLRPCFLQLFRIEDQHYIYLLRLDLNIRLSESNIARAATNDRTADFTTDRLYFESQFIPVDKPDLNASGGSIPINRLFDSTWIGETGSGYHINGEWIDRELTKMLSALYLPQEKKTYPYYPFRCDFNTVTLNPAMLSLSGRKNFLSYFHKSIPKLRKSLPAIEEKMKAEPFSRDMPLFIELKKKIPDEWTKIWSSLKISPYLNENEMREYSLEYQL